MDTDSAKLHRLHWQSKAAMEFSHFMHAEILHRFQSCVALRLPPQSKTASVFQFFLSPFCTSLYRIFTPRGLSVKPVIWRRPMPPSRVRNE